MLRSNVYEIAEVLNITTGRVSQIKKSAVSRLRVYKKGRLVFMTKNQKMSTINVSVFSAYLKLTDLRTEETSSLVV